MATSNFLQMGIAITNQTPVWMYRRKCLCERCKHEWWPRWAVTRALAQRPPARCPKCRRKDWDRQD